MRKIFLLAIVFQISLLSAQDLKFLDNNNGYKTYKFGKSPKELNNIKRSSVSDEEFYTSKGIVEYVYTGDNLRYMFNSKIRKIVFLFIKNKLYGIGFSLGELEKDYTLEEFNQMEESFTSTFGKDYVLAKRNPAIVKSYIWKGEKVTLELSLLNLDYKTPKNRRLPKEGSIYIFHQKLNTEVYKSEF
ncbi:hypothetical protein [Tenacibaculum piscium]|uniref:hypothetical protein n=1 Tax=Tenacibaculum piscium TaxID=1458515 RepID=UPI00187B6364|nr:hypothetical protein [Tenacibaculum piscium]MBE7630478.1 hypothetical protein [Tenacibaculum piscium]MBE7671686.1 hypothetical protein [Tenacibaculum piscium]